MNDDTTAVPIGADATRVATDVEAEAAADANAAESDARRVVSEAEAELKQLLQAAHDKIIALGGATWLSDATAELREARNSIEAAAEWVAEHFNRQGASNAQA